MVEGIAGIAIPELNYTLDGVNQWKGLMGYEDVSNDEYSNLFLEYRQCSLF